jgi:hypothetical protein
MTEADWLAGKVNIFSQYDSLRRRKVTSRKFRLFGCACCRRVWNWIGDQRSRDAVEVAERFADGEANRKTLAAARAICPGRGQGRGEWAAKAAVSLTSVPTKDAVLSVVFCTLHVTRADGLASSEERQQIALLQDIIGNPFRRPVIDSTWLSWNGGTVVKLAQSIYDERSFAELPILADALLDAGCVDQSILSHCRSEAAHVRGCWVVDALLGKN